MSLVGFFVQIKWNNFHIELSRMSGTDRHRNYFSCHSLLSFEVNKSLDTWVVHTLDIAMGCMYASGSQGASENLEVESENITLLKLGHKGWTVYVGSGVYVHVLACMCVFMRVWWGLWIDNMHQIQKVFSHLLLLWTLGQALTHQSQDKGL